MLNNIDLTITKFGKKTFWCAFSTDLLYNMQKTLGACYWASLNKTPGLEIRLLFCSSVIKMKKKKKYSITCIYILAANQVTLPFEFCFPQNGPNPFPVWLPWLQHGCTRDDCSSLSLQNNSVLITDKKISIWVESYSCWHARWFFSLTLTGARIDRVYVKNRKSIDFTCFLAIVQK